MPKAKAIIKEQMPVRKHLTFPEAAAYLNMGATAFGQVVIENSLFVSAVKGKKFVRVADLDNLIESHAIINA